jgi:hypothetical protein
MATTYDLSGCACCGVSTDCCPGYRIPKTLNMFVEVDDNFPGAINVIGSFNVTLTYGTYTFATGTFTGWYGCYSGDTCLGIFGVFVLCDPGGPGIYRHVQANMASCAEADFSTGVNVTSGSYSCSPLYQAQDLLAGFGYGTGQGYCTGASVYIRVYGTLTE